MFKIVGIGVEHRVPSDATHIRVMQDAEGTDNVVRGIRQRQRQGIAVYNLLVGQSMPSAGPMTKQT